MVVLKIFKVDTYRNMTTFDDMLYMSATKRPIFIKFLCVQRHCNCSSNEKRTLNTHSQVTSIRNK